MVIAAASTKKLRFDINQNDLDDGDQHDGLNRIKSPYKHDYIQIGGVSETQSDFTGFTPDMHGFEGNGEYKDAYQRNIPAQFLDQEDESVDQFTKNVMQNYATEGVTKDGKPNGHFFITRAQAMKLGSEVVEQQLAFKGPKKEEYLHNNFDETWDHYDEAKSGVLDALEANSFMRQLCRKEKEIDLQ